MLSVNRLLLCTLLCIPQCLVKLTYAEVTHDSQQVLNFPARTHKTSSHVEQDHYVSGILRRFEAKNDVIRDWVLELAQEHDLDVWHVASDSYVDIYSPLAAPELPRALLELSHNSTSITTPIPTHAPENGLLNGIADRWNLSTFENSTYHSSYHPLSEIEEFMRTLADLHPDEVSVVRLGVSSMDREIFALRISTTPQSIVGHEESSMSKKKKKKGKDSEQHKSSKMGVVISGAQHAREWIAMSTTLYLAHALVSNSSESHSIRRLLDNYDFYIIPVPNPDGYAYTWESERFWYKNRQVIDPKARCVGIDTNRNWGYKWKAATSLTPLKKHKNKGKPVPADPCSVWYPGNRPFQAPEVNNIANFVTALNGAGGPTGKIQAFFDLRSYGQMLSSPYSYSCKRVPKDAEDQIEAGLGGAQAIKASHGTVFKTGSLCSTLYRAPGNIVDWMYARAGIKYTYSAFLRDTGTYGFSLPPQWIRPVGEETAKMVEYLADFIVKQRK